MKRNLERFAEYNILVEDKQGVSKYSENLDKIEKKKTQIDDEFKEYLRDLTLQQFRPSDVEIPAEYRKKIPQNGIVTLFVKNCEYSKFYKEPILVKMIEKWKDGIGSGWLINVEKG